MTQDNYFTLFDLPLQYDIDLKALTQAFRKLMHENHPDKFVTADEQIRLAAMQNASTINTGFNTLKDPIKRTAHLLMLMGITVDLDNPPNQDPIFLMQQMELREALSEVTNLTQLEAFTSTTITLQQEIESNIKTALATNQPNNAATELAKLQFIVKLNQEIANTEDTLH